VLSANHVDAPYRKSAQSPQNERSDADPRAKTGAQAIQVSGLRLVQIHGLPNCPVDAARSVVLH